MGTRSTVKGLCMVNVAWEEQANGPEGAYCRVRLRLANIIVDDANSNWEECVCDADPNPNARTYVTGTRVAEEGVVAKEDEQA